MSAPHIAAQRANWQNCICADRAIKLVPTRVGIIISNYINSTSGEAWPSQGTIADILGMKKYNVTNAIRALVSNGYLSVTKQKGQVNRYQLRLPDGVRPDTSSSRRTDVQPDTPKAFLTGVPSDTSAVSARTPDRCFPRHPILERTGLIIEGAAPEGASANVSVPAIALDEQLSLAGSPDGARLLPGRLQADIEDAFGRDLHQHEIGQFADLIDRIGRRELERRLAAYRSSVEAGLTRPVAMVRWLRQGGLMAVRHVA